MGLCIRCLVQLESLRGAFLPPIIISYNLWALWISPIFLLFSTGTPFHTLGFIPPPWWVIRSGGIFEGCGRPMSEVFWRRNNFDGAPAREPATMSTPRLGAVGNFRLLLELLAVQPIPLTIITNYLSLRSTILSLITIFPQDAS